MDNKTIFAILIACLVFSPMVVGLTRDLIKKLKGKK